jgi:hypothetical protein
MFDFRPAATDVSFVCRGYPENAKVSKEKWEGALMLPPRLMPELEAVLLLQDRRAHTWESAVGRVGDHTGIVDQETTLTRTTDARR